jgi:hypothetical protein
MTQDQLFLKAILTLSRSIPSPAPASKDHAHTRI